MRIFIDKTTRLLVQGLSVRGGYYHTKPMMEHGTPVVARHPPGTGAPAVHRGSLDLVRPRERRGWLTEVPPGLERGPFGSADVSDLREALVKERDRRLGRATIQPRQETEGEHVLGP